MSRSEETYTGPELFDKREKTENKSELLIRNELQIELAMRWAKDIVHRNEEIAVWSDKYSEKFSSIYNRELIANNNLIDKLNNASFREGFIEMIEAELYSGDSDIMINRDDEVEFRKAA